MSEIISVRIPKELRKKMKKFSYVNWSEIVREAIKRRVKIEEKRQRKIEATRDMDKTRNRMLQTYGAIDYDSVEVIRYWRRIKR